MWVHSFVGVSWNGLSGGWRAVGTLLGPERTGIEGSRKVPFFACFFLRAGLLPNCFGLRPGCVVVLVGFGLLFENCTVDASIFVAKFLRAHGGCLGTRSR
jgi:hypothetical protein